MNLGKTILLICLAAAPASVEAAAEPAFQEETAKWRSQREARLKTDDGWLTVAGLFWLKEGANTAGSDSASDILLPSGPARAGVFEFHQGRTVLRASPGAAFTLKGKPAPVVDMQSDVSGPPTVVSLGGLGMYVIQRGTRYGIRLKDRNSKARREFQGLRWFPPDPAYRVSATFVSYKEPTRIPIPNVLGEVEQLPSPGYVVFQLAGQTYRLHPVAESGGRLFFIFRDLTSGKETYPSGRFLYAEAPRDGKVTLDFNRAENPPCAFTPYATCPLPPRRNRLPIAIRAGELNYHH